MKTGILTFHRAVNYGAVFQTYALKQVLLDMELEAAVLDYRCKAIEQPYIPVIHWKNPKTAAMDILSYGRKKKKKKNFESFLQKYITPVRCDGDAGFAQMDALITGSDQVWNSTLTGHDMAFFLDVKAPTAKRVAYAACTGKVCYSNQEQLLISQALDKFNAISVRDAQSFEKISPLTKQTVARTIDPTLLMDSSNWEAVTAPVSYKDYVLVFAVGFSEQLSDFAHDIANKKNKKVIFLNSSLRKKGKGMYLDTVGPDVALGLIQKADYVVTNSFHGTAMSLAMQKEFFVELEHDKKGRNHRVESLLQSVGIAEREIVSSTYREEKFSVIDWDKVQNNIRMEREKSLAFLKNGLGIGTIQGEG